VLKRGREEGKEKFFLDLLEVVTIRYFTGNPSPKE
jgi:hypothetical protein